MADEKRARSASLAARTRERTFDLRGPSTRRSARAVERSRVERGRTSLLQAHGGAPSRADFLKQADLFQFLDATKRVNFAFIVPQGLDDPGLHSCQIFWYRRNAQIQFPACGEKLRVRSSTGETYVIRFEEDIGQPSTVVLGGSRFQRTCTGTALCSIF